MNPKAKALQERTHSFFMQVMRLCESLSDAPEAASIRDQLLDSSGSTDSNYRAACKARSRKNSSRKSESRPRRPTRRWDGSPRSGTGASLADADVAPLIIEANELTSIFVKSGKTAKHNMEAEARRVALARRRRRSR
jgi:hypothetical protein